MRNVRLNSELPVIIITGHRCDDIDRVVGLELGADDYLTKPFNLRELLARVRAVLRRFNVGRATPSRDPERGRLRFSGWQLDRKRRRLTDPAGAQVALTNGEYAMLLAFLEAPLRPLSRDHLLQATRVHEDASTAASMCKFFASAASSNATPVHRASSRPSAVLDICSLFPSSGVLSDAPLAGWALLMNTMLYVRASLRESLRRIGLFASTLFFL